MTNAHMLGWAIGELATAVAGDEEVRVRSCCNRAVDHIHEFLGDEYGRAVFTEAEAELSRNLHSSLRKYDDSPTGTILYLLVQDSRGMVIWQRFVSGLAGLGPQPRIRDVDGILHRLEPSDTDEILMDRALAAHGAERLLELLAGVRDRE